MSHQRFHVLLCLIGVGLTSLLRGDEIAFVPKLLDEPAAARTGYLGDPQLGLNLDDWHLVWHPKGRLFSSCGGFRLEEDMLIHPWKAPIGQEPARCLGTMNVGFPWTLSNSGNLLLGHLLLPNQNLTRGAQPKVVFGCLQLTNSTKIWHRVMEKGEHLHCATFSQDDSHVLVATSKTGQRTLTWINTASGEVESRLPLQEREASDGDSGRSLVKWRDEFIMLRKTGDGEGRLERVRTDPLRVVEEIPCKSLEDPDSDSLCLSQDGRWLVVYGTSGYEVLEHRKDRWLSVLEGQAGDGWLSGSNVSGVALSSDSRLMAVATGQTTKVIDLAAARVLKELAFGCYAVAFSPDDSQLLMAEHSGLGWWDTKKWEYHKAQSGQHDCPVEGLLAIPESQVLISRDHNDLIVWDLPSRKARAILKAKRSECWVGAPVLASHGREIIAADGRDFMRWRLPDLTDPVPVKPIIIVAEPAFTNISGSELGPDKMAVIGNASGSLFLTVGEEGLVQLHDLNSPGTVRTFPALAGIPYLASKEMMFLNDTTISILDADASKLLHLYLGSGKVVEVPLEKREGKPVLWMPAKSVPRIFGAQVNFMDGETGKVLFTLAAEDRRQRFVDGMGLATSADGKLAAACFWELSSRSDRSLVIVELASGKLLGKLPLMKPSDISCLGFSSDGKTLFMGHKNTAVSLWNVETILQNGGTPVSAPVTTESPRTLASRPATRVARQVVSHLPEKPLPDRRGRPWTFRPDGSCVIEPFLPSFGVLHVNGKPFTASSTRYLKSPHENELFDSGTSLSQDGALPEEKVWISRQLRFSPSFVGDVVLAVDGFTNTSNQPVDLDIDFAVQFPADAEGLLTDAAKRINIPEDGLFSLGTADHWLAAAGSGKLQEPLAAVRVKTWTSQASPKLHWEKTGHLLHVGYHVTVPPAETRWMVHGVALVERTAEGALDVVNFPHSADVGHYVPPGSHAQAINFGRPDMWNGEHDHGPLPSTMSWASTDPKPKPESDALGFTWELRHDLSRSGGLGAEGVHAVWFDGHPSEFIAEKLLHAHINGKLVSPPVNSHAGAAPGVIMLRQPQVVEGGSSTVWLDTFSNTTEEVRNIHVSYVTTFRSPVVAVWDAHGNKHDLASFSGSTAALGGACAFVLKGDEEPATLPAFYGEGSSKAPTLRWMGPSAIALDYELELGPKAREGLLHGACQRPLGAFGDAKASAFEDWLPLQLPSRKIPTSNPSLPVEPLQILNYTATKAR